MSRLYSLTFSDEGGEEDVVEFEAYTPAQAEAYAEIFCRENEVTALCLECGVMNFTAV